MGILDGLFAKKDAGPKPPEDDSDVDAILAADGSVDLETPQKVGPPRGGPPKGRPSTASQPGLKPLQQVNPGAPPPPPGPSGGSDVPRTFAEIYRVQKIQVPAHGYSADKVIELLNSQRLQALPEAARVASVQVILDQSQVPMRDILEDAMAKASALEAYEAWQEKKFAEADAAAETEAQRLEAELVMVTAQVRGQIEASRKGPSMRAQAMATWRAQRDEELRRLHMAASLATPPGEENPIPAPQGTLQGFGGPGQFNPFQPPPR